MNHGPRTICKSAIVIASLLFVSLGPAARAQAADSPQSAENLIEAGFIYNFAKLMEWPAATFPQTSSPITIGILGETDPFRGTLDQVLRGKQVNGRDFVVKHLKWKDDLKGCNILFVSSSEKAHFDDLLHVIHGLPILTIGDTPGFAERGGVINFVVEGNRVRFEINVDAAKQANITISSRLLALARIVSDAGADGKKAP